jgi:hypothetical protein
MLDLAEAKCPAASLSMSDHYLCQRGPFFADCLAVAEGARAFLARRRSGIPFATAEDARGRSGGRTYRAA